MGTSPHPGEIEARRRAGVPDPGRSPSFIRTEVPPVGVEFLERQSSLFVGYADDEGAPWVTLLTGEAGFLTSSDGRSLRIETPDLDANPLLADLATGSAVGTLAIDFGTRDRVRLNGTVESRSDGSVVISIDEVFSNCRKYIQTREPASGPTGHAFEFESEVGEEFRTAVAAADTLFVVTGNDEIGFDVSHRGGVPGFLHWEGEDLVLPDYQGNRLFQTIGNLLVDPQVGVLIFDFDSGRSHHGTGRAEVIWEAGSEPGVERQVRVRLARAMSWSSDRAWVAPTAGMSPHVPPLGRAVAG